MEVSALDFVKALVDILENDPASLYAGLKEGVKLNSVDDPDGSYDYAEVRISFGAGDLFDLKIERV